MSDSSHPRPDDQRPPLPEAWLDFVAEAGPEGDPFSGGGPGIEPSAALASDEARAAALRAVGHVRALRSLPRAAAPAELEGLVVASLHAGFRQDRAIEHYRRLQPKRAPEVLDDVVLGVILGEGGASPSGSSAAPKTLDALVEDAVADPSAFIASKMTGRLPALTAPDELAGRLAGRLGEAGSGGRTGPAHRGWASRRSLAALAGGLLALVGAGILSMSLFDPTGGTDAGFADRSTASETRGRVSLTIIRVDQAELTAADRRTARALGVPILGGSS